MKDSLGIGGTDAVPMSIATSPMKPRGPKVPRICSLPVARLEDFQLAAQDHRQPEITLASFVYQFAVPHDAARTEGL
jgi:hypothetical protein